jgi:hypothetical protein
MDIQEISETWPKLFAELLGRHTLADAAHDPNHIRRVVTNARRLTLAEGADWLVVMPAAWLHDCVAVPKSPSSMIGSGPNIPTQLSNRILPGAVGRIACSAFEPQVT